MGVTGLRLSPRTLKRRFVRKDAEGISTWMASGGTEFGRNGGGLGGMMVVMADFDALVLGETVKVRRNKTPWPAWDC
jgi:hypothetical protein